MFQEDNEIPEMLLLGTRIRLEIEIQRLLILVILAELFERRPCFFCGMDVIDGG